MAGWWRRCVSFLYEILLLAAVLLIAEGLFQGAFQLVSGLPAARVSELAWVRAVNGVWLLAIGLAYFGWCWTRSGQTLAMQTWRNRLLAVGGASVSWRKAAIRFALAVLFYVPLIPLWVLSAHEAGYLAPAWGATAWFALPWVWALFDRDGQLLHDRIAGTQIVFAPKKPKVAKA